MHSTSALDLAHQCPRLLLYTCGTNLFTQCDDMCRRPPGTHSLVRDLVLPILRVHTFFGHTTLDAGLGTGGVFGALLSLLHFLDIEVDVKDQTGHGNGSPVFIQFLVVVFFVARPQTESVRRDVVMNANSGLLLLPSPAPHGSSAAEIQTDRQADK